VSNISDGFKSSSHSLTIPGSEPRIIVAPSYRFRLARRENRSDHTPSPRTVLWFCDRSQPYRNDSHVGVITCRHQETPENKLAIVEPCECLLVTHTMPCRNHVPPLVEIVEGVSPKHWG
jgi:hypothetical protein